MHLSSAISFAPSARAVATASSISASVAIPVERINGLPVRATAPDQRQIHQLEGGDFVRADPQVFQKIDRRLVERARKKCQAQFVRDGLEFRLPLPWHRCFAVEIVQVAVFPDRAMADPEMLFLRIDRDRVRGVCLHFDRIRARRPRGADELNRGVEIVLMIRGELGDHVNWMPGADGPALDFNLGAHCA